MYFFRMLARNFGQTVDGVFINAGQTGGLPNAVLLEKVIQNSYGLIKRQTTAEKRRTFAFRKSRPA